MAVHHSRTSTDTIDIRPSKIISELPPNSKVTRIPSFFARLRTDDPLDTIEKNSTDRYFTTSIPISLGRTEVRLESVMNSWPANPIASINTIGKSISSSSLSTSRKANGTVSTFWPLLTMLSAWTTKRHSDTCIMFTSLIFSRDSDLHIIP